MKKNVKLFIGLILIGLLGLLSHNLFFKNNTISFEQNIDSLQIKNTYDSLFLVRSTNAYQSYHKIENEILNDSVLNTTNNLLFSKILFNEAKYDSAYYYLNKSSGYAKNNSEMTFYNTLEKINFSIKNNLLNNALFELNNAKELSNNSQTHKWHILLKEIEINQKIRNQIKYDSLIQVMLSQKITNSKNESLQYEFDRIYFNHLLENKEYKKLEKIASQKIANSLKEEKLNNNFFENLNFIIKSKTESKSDSIEYYFYTYQSLEKYATRSDYKINLPFLKAQYHESQNSKTLALVYYKKALENSVLNKNVEFENIILKKLIYIDSINAKQNIRKYIENKKTISDYRSAFYDNILRINLDTEKLFIENTKLKKVLLVLCIFVLAIILALFLLFVRNKQKQKNNLLIAKNKYQNKSISLYKYLIDIKEQIDFINISKNKEFLSFLNNEIINRLQELINTIDKENDFNDCKTHFYTSEIIEIERKVRAISHQIHENFYQHDDLKLLLNHIITKNNCENRIELFVEENINYSIKKFKKILATMMFIDQFIKTIFIKHKIDKCFISCFPKNNKIIIRIWVNSEIPLDENLLSNLNDKKIKYKITRSDDLTIKFQI